MGTANKGRNLPIKAVLYQIWHLNPKKHTLEQYILAYKPVNDEMTTDSETILHGLDLLGKNL